MSLDEDSNVAEEARAPTVGFGELLSQAREQSGYSQRDVGVELHLKPEIIQAIDDENLEELPEPAYVRGYLRSYARLVGIDVEQVLDAYAALNHEAPEWEFNEPARHEVAQGRNLTPVTIIVVVIILGLLVTWLMTEGNGTNVDAESEVVAEAEVEAGAESGAGAEVELPAVGADTSGPDILAVPDDVDVAQQPEAITEEPRLETDVPLAEVSVTEDEPLALEQEATDEVAVTDDSLDNFELASVEAEGTDRVVLKFNNESWAEVFDANDVQLLRGLMKSGTIQRLTGTAPFSVFLGNTPAVEITINDVEFDATPYMRRDSVSRFTLKAP